MDGAGAANRAAKMIEYADELECFVSQLAGISDVTDRVELAMRIKTSRLILGHIVDLVRTEAALLRAEVIGFALPETA